MTPDAPLTVEEIDELESFLRDARPLAQEQIIKLCALARRALSQEGYRREPWEDTLARDFGVETDTPQSVPADTSPILPKDAKPFDYAPTISTPPHDGSYWDGEFWRKPDTPQSVPACPKCEGKGVIWWMRPGDRPTSSPCPDCTPDAPLSQGELVKDLNNRAKAFFAGTCCHFYEDDAELDRRAADALSALERERDTAKKMLGEAYDGIAWIGAERDKLIEQNMLREQQDHEEKEALRAERDKLRVEWAEDANQYEERIDKLKEERDGFEFLFEKWHDYSAVLSGDNAKLVERVSVLEAALNRIVLLKHPDSKAIARAALRTSEDAK
jgi:hypothetical protein